MNRRCFLDQGGSCIVLSLSSSAFGIGVPYRVMTHLERVDAALEGQPVDRPPYTIYLMIEHSTPEREAHQQLRFHKSFNTDIVKVTSPYPYPASGPRGWFDIEVVESPVPGHLKTLQMIGTGLKGRAYFVDTICSPFTTAWHLFKRHQQTLAGASPEVSEPNWLREFRDFQNSDTDTWRSALEAITQSTINYIRLLKNIGVSGAFVNVVNMSSRFGTPEEYRQYSKPFDDRIFRELSGTKLTILHLEELDAAFLNQQVILQAPIVHYSTVRTGIPISEVRKCYSGTIMGGVDEISYGKLSAGTIRRQWTAAWAEAGPRFIAAPGGAVPAKSTGRQIGHLQDSLGAW